MSIPRFAAALLGTVLTIAASLAAAEAPPRGDPAHGKEIYGACLYCHAIDANRVGPLHRGLFGRRAGSVPGFAYSKAMKRAGARGLIWNEKTLDAYLTNPQGLVPGTKMLFGGIADGQTRADLIAYLKAAMR